MSTTFTLGFSPCPNDTFIFDALINGKIDTGDLHFEPFMEDVEALNNMALKGLASITKLSFYAYSRVAHNYQLLDSGAALGVNCGPLLVSSKPMRFEPTELAQHIQSMRIAVPGFNTTANALLSFFYPQATDKYACLFSDIENDVLNGNADAGLIIHEGRFTYQQKGLHKLVDMGELWEKHTHGPLPLGGIAIRRDLPEDVKKHVNKLVKESVCYAFANPDSGKDYIRQHAQEMEESVIRKHIELYVNDYSIDLGTKGRKAIELFLNLIDPGRNQAASLFL